jgi:hypothetical protein
MEKVLIHTSDALPEVEIFVVSISLLDAVYFTTDRWYYG